MLSNLKRFGFFFAVNISIVLTISFIARLLGIEPHLNSQGLNYTHLMIFCFMYGMIASFISLMLSKWMAKTFYGVQLIDEREPSYGWVVSSVHQMAKQAGLTTMPEVGVYQSPELNAFATGPSKNNSLVAVSTGLISQMDKDEVEGVLGHEVSHIANGDMVTMTLIQGVINAFVMFLARIAAHAIDAALRGNDDDRRGGGLGFFGYFIVVSIFEVVFGLVGMLVTSYFSRWREYRADAGGAALAGKDKMVKSLQALQRNYETMTKIHEEDRKRDAIAALQISNKTSLMAFLSTHPPLETRIKRLQGEY